MTDHAAPSSPAPTSGRGGRGAGDTVRAVADAALEATVLGSFSTIGYRARRRLWGWDELDDLRLDGREIVVTGATSGLGLAAARRCAAAGARLHLVGRDRARTEAAAAGLGARADRPPAVHVADLTDPRQVVSAASSIRAATDRLDGLVHNAGALLAERTETADGLEASFAGMVLGPHVLTHELRAPLEAARGRVVWVTSGGMYTQRLDLDDLQTREGYTGTKAYARAKRAQVDLTAEWAARLAPVGVTVHAMHPGWADTPGVAESLPTFRRVLGPVLRTPEQGADTIVWLLAADEPPAHSGALWLDRRRRSTARVPGTATSGTDRRRLWDECERLRVSLTPPV